ncbi:Rrf2 family transcriptional regulator [Deinococcus budaensis]|uniref:Rrf2 family protein n=1 Tax=Deinococcus budaensis TaxID=1665626 RepID=A0A7W8GE92_9DEIO|nr:Rrf2 family protein [Deinococcus budaensis]
MFSQTTEYALRAVVTLAGAADRPLTTAEIAERTQVPPGYLSKVLQTLGRAGLIQASRGLRGGYRLSRPAHAIPMLEVVNAVGPLGRVRECPLGLPQHTALCPLHRQIDDAVAHIERQLASKTLHDMIDPALTVPGAPGTGTPDPAPGLLARALEPSAP